MIILEKYKFGLKYEPVLNQGLFSADNPNPLHLTNCLFLADTSYKNHDRRK